MIMLSTLLQSFYSAVQARKATLSVDRKCCLENVDEMNLRQEPISTCLIDPDMVDLHAEPIGICVENSDEANPKTTMVGSCVDAADEVDSHVELIRPYVDANFYYTQYRDVASQNLDAAFHYYMYGWKEGRNPSAAFSTSSYLERFPQLTAVDINPILHYVQHMPNTADVELGEPDNSAQPIEQEERYRKKFDRQFYIESNPDVDFEAVDPIEHYENVGWREGRDPSPAFSTKYYLRMYKDIAEGCINPFRHYVFHGVAEGRVAQPFLGRKTSVALYRPIVSIIVPNYNHKQFLRKRLDTLINHTYQNIELIIVDDCSSDGSQEIIEDYASKYPDIISYIPNEMNVGRIFLQWRKGFDAAKGDLIWVCESDDFCELNFLEKILPHFVDRSVMLAFGRVQFANEDGSLREGLDDYRNEAEFGIWGEARVRSAHEWFQNAFAISNIIPNVGGCVFRNNNFTEEEWAEAVKFNILGDWYLYLISARGGRVAYEPSAVSYFRQHGQNTSVKSFNEPSYYIEHEDLIRQVIAHWGPPEAVLAKFYSRVQLQFERSALRTAGKVLEEFCSLDRILSAKRQRRHIVIGILGFKLGGGEIFPIQLANEVINRGDIVSLVVQDTRSEVAGVRRLLNSKIAIYEAELINELGTHQFLEQIGATLFHSHYIGLEYFFLVGRECSAHVPYIVTLHGSYDSADIERSALLSIICGVDHWVYLTRRNLRHLRGVPLRQDIFSRIENGVAFDERPFSLTREGMNIGDGDIVFVLASRAIQEKGWREAILATRKVRETSHARIVLLLCGSGPFADSLREEFYFDCDISFLGYQDRVHGLYALADCVILPTRFVGESFPLTLIQAMQVGRPIISTNIGEIGGMVGLGHQAAGILIDPNEDDEKFIESLTEAMIVMLDKKNRAAFAANAVAKSKSFSIGQCADAYDNLYSRVLGKGDENGADNCFQQS